MPSLRAKPEPFRSPIHDRSFAVPVVEPGDTLADRYRLDREVARTEAGVVFDGLDLSLDRRVAVEVASSLEEPTARRKWTRDAMLAQRLEGEHVLRVLDVGNLAGGVPYVVREAALCTMAAEVEVKGALPIEVAACWTLEACEAIAEAHALGMAHGDLRLENIYLVRRDGDAHPMVKVAWTSAAKAERAAKEDVARDLAGLGALLRVLSTGRTSDDEADGAPTLPTDLAHAVARALSIDPRDRIHNVAELARILAPYAPPGHSSARNVAFLMSRAGIVGGMLPSTAPPSSRRPSGIVAVTPTAPGAPAAATDRASFTDEWFGRAPRTPLRESLAPVPVRRRARPAFAVVSLSLIALVLGGSWFLWENGKLPRWTGAAPPDAVGNTEVTSAPAATAEPVTVTPTATPAPPPEATPTPPAEATATPAVTSPPAEAKATSVPVTTTTPPAPKHPRADEATTTARSTTPTTDQPTASTTTSTPTSDSTTTSPSQALRPAPENSSSPEPSATTPPPPPVQDPPF